METTKDKQITDALERHRLRILNKGIMPERWECKNKCGFKCRNKITLQNHERECQLYRRSN